MQVFGIIASMGSGRVCVSGRGGGGRGGGVNPNWHKILAFFGGVLNLINNCIFLISCFRSGSSVSCGISVSFR